MGRSFEKINLRKKKMSIWLEETNAFKANISENQGEALPPANYASFTESWALKDRDEPVCNGLDTAKNRENENNFS
uniref:Uncharacterized protein n=1 Tax=Megaselia scalaris TaxID=36166 RepID=T1GSM9_MEGSC